MEDFDLSGERGWHGSRYSRVMAGEKQALIETIGLNERAELMRGLMNLNVATRQSLGDKPHERFHGRAPPLWRKCIRKVFEVEAAKEDGLPIMQNVPLARDPSDQGNLDHYIPSNLLEPVAEVLLWVQRMEQDKHGL